MRIEEFLEDLQIERGLSPATLRNRRSYLGMFLKALPHPLEECSTMEIKLTLHQLRERYKVNTFSMLLYISLKYMKAAGIDITKINIKSPGRENTKTPADISRMVYHGKRDYFKFSSLRRAGLFRAARLHIALHYTP